MTMKYICRKFLLFDNNFIKWHNFLIVFDFIGIQFFIMRIVKYICSKFLYLTIIFQRDTSLWNMSNLIYSSFIFMTIKKCIFFANFFIPVLFSNKFFQFFYDLWFDFRINDILCYIKCYINFHELSLLRCHLYNDLIVISLTNKKDFVSSITLSSNTSKFRIIILLQFFK